MTTNPKVKKVITEIVDGIIKGYEPKKIILFGSYACGKPSEDSDIDLPSTATGFTCWRPRRSRRSRAACPGSPAR